MDERPHLATLLSQVLVAFTIEADSEFESRMPHRTALSRAAGEPERGPWLISLAMWANFLKYVPDNGIAVDELGCLSGIRRPDVDGMTRWGYVSVDDGVLSLTRGGKGARRVWTAIEDRIETRWRGRFGEDVIVELREALDAADADVADVWPDYLPVVGYGLVTMRQLGADRDRALTATTFSAVLSRALTTIAVAFERTAPISLALAANALRVIEPSGTLVRDIPSLAGIAKEITDVSLGHLEKDGLAQLRTEGRARIATLTGLGVLTRENTDGRRAELDAGFEAAREPLERILSNTDGLVEALTPQPSAWRSHRKYAAQTKRLLTDPRAALPHFPIVTHRGGFPDGS